jgi:nucleotide-binding universal stress UspA family protein
MWDYKALLVQAGLEETAEARILLAADLADRFDATLIGLAAGPLENADRLRQAEEAFHATSRRAARHREWRCASEPLDGVLTREARSADLLILGLKEAAACGPPALNTLAARAGRALLLVPERARVLDASRVLVAWRNTGATRRAIASALPILRLAERVALRPAQDGEPEEEVRLGMADMAGHLRRHGVPAELLADMPAEEQPPEGILGAARRMGADLVVMGECEADWLRGATAPAIGVDGQPGPCWLLGP